ncbi:Uncharacterised protein [Clostridium baratii]|nr:Uncharacterised protein [Clostridium baratii]
MLYSIYYTVKYTLLLVIEYTIVYTNVEKYDKIKHVKSGKLNL